MNLLSILIAVMTSKTALGQVSGKTGLSQKQVRKLMMIAIPILLKYMTLLLRISFKKQSYLVESIEKM